MFYSYNFVKKILILVKLFAVASHKSLLKLLLAFEIINNTFSWSSLLKGINVLEKYKIVIFLLKIPFYLLYK